MSTGQILFVLAASIMLLEAVGYSIAALRPIHQACAPSDPYWNRRLLLNLMLANAGLYFASLYTFVGAYLGSTSPGAASVVLAVSVLACFYSVATIPFITPKDWWHALFRGVAGVLIIFGLIAA